MNPVGTENVDGHRRGHGALHAYGGHGGRLLDPNGQGAGGGGKQSGLILERLNCYESGKQERGLTLAGLTFATRIAPTAKLLSLAR